MHLVWEPVVAMCAAVGRKLCPPAASGMGAHCADVRCGGTSAVSTRYILCVGARRGDVRCGGAKVMPTWCIWYGSPLCGCALRWDESYAHLMHLAWEPIVKVCAALRRKLFAISICGHDRTDLCRAAASFPLSP